MLCAEAWVNALDRGGWNVLHVHPGSAFSGVLYVSGPEPADHGFAGRLVLCPQASCGIAGCGPDELRHLRFGTEDRVLAHEPDKKRRRKQPACPDFDPCPYLVIDPKPGTLVIFPSFVPHFVVPTEHVEKRVSVAFNFGPCDSVNCNVLDEETDGGEKRYRVFLEPTLVVGLSDPSPTAVQV